jgi:hypothetical protein
VALEIAKKMLSGLTKGFGRLDFNRMDAVKLIEQSSIINDGKWRELQLAMACERIFISYVGYAIKVVPGDAVTH